MSRNSGRRLLPARAVWPLPPRPEVLPRVEDWPRPTLRYARLVMRTRLESVLDILSVGDSAQSFDSDACVVYRVLGARQNLGGDVGDAGELEHGSYRGACYQSAAS